MNGLMRSKSGPGNLRRHELQACAVCFGERFREQADSFRETFRVYRATAAGDLWRTMKQPGVDLAPVTSDLICVTCEQEGEKSARPGTKRKLVAYDYRTGAPKEIEPE